MNIKKYKIAFIGWNPFQFIHIKDFAKAIPNSVFILEKRKDNLKYFSKDILNNSEVPILVLNPKEIKNLDGKYDIIIAQTVFNYSHKFNLTKLVMLQYSYAKEPHQYGTWRALSDLTLVYGEYAAKKISYFTPVEPIGNPRFDIWHQSSFHENARKKYEKMLNKDKKTLLYMPTWGSLSSLDLFLERIAALSDKYNVLIKVHHNTDLKEKSRIKNINLDKVNLLGASDDSLMLLSLADIVITDYSGAIFDAIYCKKPLILLDLDNKILSKEEKLDTYSLELKNRDNLGERVSEPSKLLQLIQKVENNYKNEISKLDSLRSTLFISDRKAIERGVEALSKLMNGEYKKTQLQKYLSSTIKTCYDKKTPKEILINFLKRYQIV